MPYNVSVFGVAAALAALGDVAHIEAERRRNTEVRAFTIKTFADLGCKSTASEGNFLFVDVGRPTKDFREACAKQGVTVARDFPPFEKTHARISIGTMDEMKKAADVFRSVLKPVTTAGLVGVTMALSRRSFVRTAGIGAAGALTSSFITSRGRENMIWSALEPTLHAVEPGTIVISSNENPMGPGAKVLDAIRAAFGS